MQNSDLLLVLGSRLNIRQTSYNWGSFARFATKIQVDIDAAELMKPTVKPEIGIHCDVKLFLSEISVSLTILRPPQIQRMKAGWRGAKNDKLNTPWSRSAREAGPTLNPYYFMDRLFDLLGPNDAIVCGNATACIVPFQAGKLKLGQRLISNSGSASMGYDLPAAIGVAFAKGSRVICLAGDGSIQMNLQELTVVITIFQ